MRLITFATVLVAMFAGAPPAHAVLPEDCPGLGVAITEHSCFHSTFGPFTTVLATAGSIVTAETPDVSPVHTEYRIGLTGEYSVVSYVPKRSGHWAVLLGSDVPLQVLAAKAQALPSVLMQNGDTGCEALPLIRVFKLEAQTNYRLVFGPTPAATAIAVIEYIDDFVTQNGRDLDGDGFGELADVITTPCIPPAGFAPNTRDCDDQAREINPEAIEVCDGVDQNCNGVADDLGLLCRSGVGACRVEGVMACPKPGAIAVCSVAPATSGPEACNGADDDCNGKIDDSDGLCADPSRPTCVRDGSSAACGCLLDLDCGEPTSGRICDAMTRTCRAGCSDVPGRNACPPGEACDARTSRCAPADVASGGGAGGAAADGPGEAAQGGTVDPGSGTNVAAGTEGQTNGKRKGGGCDCRAAGSSQGTPATLALGTLLLLVATRRRRRRPASLSLLAWLMVGLSVLACGGRVVEGMPQPGTGSATAGATSMSIGGGPSDAPPQSSAGLGGEGSTCQPELGEQLVAHACAHTTNGPFVPLVASGGAAATPDVSELHQAYEVQIVGKAATLNYRAQREASHAFMTAGGPRFAVLHDGAQLPEQRSFPVHGCSTLAEAVVYDLVREQEYTLQIAQGQPELLLFVEHLGDFGDQAWALECSAPAQP